MSGYYYEQTLFDGVVRLKGGKHDANSHFGESDITGQFINGGISPAPNVPMTTYPDPGVGFVVFVNPTDWLSMAGGVYGAEPDGESFDAGGLFSGKTFSIFQVDLHGPFVGYPGTYRAGGWLQTVDTVEITSVPDPRVFDEDFGFYLLFDQRVYREGSGTSDDEGMDLYFQLSWAPPERNDVALWVGGGAMYTGPIPGRARDLAGFSAISAGPTHRLPGLQSEVVLEWFYRVLPLGWLSVEPDVQYFINPGGDGSNALMVGMRTAIAF